MATKPQIQANRANAARSTGPRTPAGTRASSQNSTRHNSFAGTLVLHGESRQRFDELAAALTLQFDPRNSTEAFLVQIMIATRWRLLRLWGMQTAGFELEMARTAESHPTLTTGPVLAAVAFRNLADNSRVLALQFRLEAAYQRQFNQALASLLKLRKTPNSGIPLDPPVQTATETWESDSQTEANSQVTPDHHPVSSHKVAEIPPATPAEPIPTLPPSPPSPIPPPPPPPPPLVTCLPGHGKHADPTFPLTALLCGSKIALEDLTMQ
ncbi:MAG TPA: hypothetical protein VGN17_15895 [Bryobacteraceae bacterium]